MCKFQPPRFTLTINPKSVHVGRDVRMRCIVSDTCLQATCSACGGDKHGQVVLELLVLHVLQQHTNIKM
jgi:hypothetical protein